MTKLLLITMVILTLGCTSRFEHGKTVALDDGLSYRFLNINRLSYPVRREYSVFYIEFDPNKYTMDLVRAKDHKQKLMRVKDYVRTTRSILAINASFFDKKHRVLGLQIQKGKKLNKIRRVDGGVFYLLNNKATICHTREYSYNNKISMAIQGLPRLVHNGAIIHRLKKQLAKRSFVGITKDHHIILGVTMDSRAYADDLAKVLALNKEAGGLGCQFALNLDGGSSTQLFLKHKGFELDLSGSSPVPNALTLFHKTNQDRHTLYPKAKD